mmetsp:Transcript_2738/g.4113  ORF Transcript_2738/g.4113 Transcript_2738/m.4113 type:complete len:83 (-) Transcript_2738:604-852(-)|eukprot:CAMPEP_0185035374 /NCGR_PEP_ID=MMETSP1103-20130426/26605_1 /TAXON_ID=36769 /ORGANISM="Paraphysomonas bandaiensis, Strain Caron Lab Isolate" /LENGTH=82 /DNA_ID=CAMNT_0027572415 /DNA_START=964 /DNA_END=1212 /DNA_ORIENTATION=-
MVYEPNLYNNAVIDVILVTSKMLETRYLTTDEDAMSSSKASRKQATNIIIGYTGTEIAIPSQPTNPIVGVSNLYVASEMSSD